MKRKLFRTSIFLSLMAAVFLVFASLPAAAGQGVGKAAMADKDDETRFIAYYFYTTKRCGPCERIEQWSKDAIEMNFQEELSAGKLEWRAINVDKPENKHFIDDFQLHTKSLIIAKVKNGDVADWKNLDRIWRLYRDEGKYFDYVTSNTRAFMEGS